MDIFNEVVGRHMGGQLIPVTRFGSTMQTFTPQWVVKDMIALLPDQVWNEHTTFLDISCKTGIFLMEIYKKLDEVLSKNPKYVDTATRRSHILNEQLYGLALDDKECLWYSSRNVYGRIGAKNMKYLHAGGYSYDQLVKNKKIEYMKALIQEEFGRNMFDVVVGNPPYNNDIYLDFVTLAQAIQTQNVCMITPAKWQAKGGPKNEAFRKEIVPYMSKIVYYKDSTDVFGIEEWGGISYFIVDKVQQTAKSVKVICNKNKSLQSDGFEKHIETELKLLPNKVIEIIDKCCVSGVLKIHMKQCEYTNQDERGHSKGEIPVMQSGNIVGYLDGAELKTVNGLEMWKISITRMIGAIGLLDNNGKTLGSAALAIIPNNCVPKGSFPGVVKFKTENECKSFVSFYNSKLISFLFYLGICGSAISNEFWRFVPDPGAFDHIFTDQELYKRYNLTDEEINIIESVIKERK